MKNREWETFDGDRDELAARLARAIEGDVRFDDGSRALYTTDASNYRQVPIGVVLPKTKEDIVNTMAVCREMGAPVLSRGGGTSLAGQSCNVAVVIDMSRWYTGIVEIDGENRTATVQPGVILDSLRDETEKLNLTFGPDPATHNRCTLGGMIGNNSCGVHSVMAGRTSDNVEELEVLLYDGTIMRVGATSDEEIEARVAAGGREGTIYEALRSMRDRYADEIRERYPDIPRRVSGYSLDELLPENGFNVARALVGTEGTCVTVLEAKLRLVHSPPKRVLAVLGYRDVYAAGDHILEVLDAGPVGLEGMDGELIRYMKRKGLHPNDVELLPEGDGWLIAEFGGESVEEAEEKARSLIGAIRKGRGAPKAQLHTGHEEQERVWGIRESGLGATAFVPGYPNAWPGWEDSAVDPRHLGEYLRELRKLYDEFGFRASLYGHFGQACVHTRIPFDLRSAGGIDTYRRFIDRAADLVLRYNGSFSGEHGDGQSRAALLPKMFGDRLVGAFREFKSLWDPDWKMNPGKVVDPYDLTENLRLGTDYNPWNPATHFKYPEDEGALSQATLRCVGVGKCRRLGGGTMCPSYMVTMEEKHSTRGRAHLLFEMLQGDVIRDGWKSKAVKDALDLCLSCKGCKSDCPVNVDLATYKAEFYAHYYEHNARPLSAWLFGLAPYWIRLGGRMPRIANFFAHAEPFAKIGKEIAGVAQERELPQFAPKSFRQWFTNRDLFNLGGPKVILWADTFSNYFRPEIARAAVEVLEANGYHVIVPVDDLCCGRPLYEFGFLNVAKRFLRRILRELRSEIRSGIPVVGLEPSCVSVFRDELTNILAHEQDAHRLRGQTYTLGEFIAKNRERFDLPKLEGRAVVHGHCHHKAIMEMYGEMEALERMGLEHELLDSGCCGMAGSFGYEKEKYEVSIACGERVLLPAVRETGENDIVIADGFSCYEQIRHGTGRRPLHLSEVIAQAMRERRAGGK